MNDRRDSMGFWKDYNNFLPRRVIMRQLGVAFKIKCARRNIDQVRARADAREARPENNILKTLVNCFSSFYIAYTCIYSLVTH